MRWFYIKSFKIIIKKRLNYYCFSNTETKTDCNFHFLEFDLIYGNGVTFWEAKYENEWKWMMWQEPRKVYKEGNKGGFLQSSDSGADVREPKYFTWFYFMSLYILNFQMQIDFVFEFLCLYNNGT